MNEKDERIFRSLNRLDTIGKDVHNARARIEMELVNTTSMGREPQHEMTNWLELLRRVDQDVSTAKLELTTHLYGSGLMNDTNYFWQATPETNTRGMMTTSRTGWARYQSSPYRKTAPHMMSDVGIGYIEPNVSISDEGKEIICRVELPGVSKDELELRVSEGNIVLATTTKTTRIRGQKQTGSQGQDQGQRTKCYYADVQLPTHVSTTTTQARLDNGILEIKLKKMDPTSGYSKIDVK
jgi:HSP20 family protein